MRGGRLGDEVTNQTQAIQSIADNMMESWTLKIKKLSFVL